MPSNEALRSGKQSKVTEPSLATSIHWERLPSIVQQAVLGELAKDYNRHSLERKRRRAAYAAVSLQWQEFFEKLNFNKLALCLSDLGSFEEIINRRSNSGRDENQGWQRQRIAVEALPTLSRMPRIQHIWFRIELLSYDCRRCKIPERAKEVIL